MPGAPLDRAALIATTVGSAAVLLDGTVVNTALPSLGRDLDLTLSGLQWVVSAYILALGSLLLVGGALGDRYGRRRAFVWGLWGFAVTSLLCGIAPGGEAEIAARVLQGAAAALLMPNSLGVLSSAHEGEARTRAIGLWSGFGALAGAAGPLLGGLLTDAVSWRAAFLVSVPACVVAALAARRIGGAADVRGDVSPALGGGLLAAAFLGTLAYGLIVAGEGGHAASALVALAVSALSLCAFVVHERRAAHPLIARVLWRSRRFAAANGVTIGVYGGLAGSLFVLALQLQNVAGYSALQAGAATLPLPLCLLLLASRAAFLVKRIGTGPTLALGSFVLAAAFVWLAMVGPESAYVREILPGMILFGLGMSCVVAPVTSAALDAAPLAVQGAASAVNIAAARVAGLIAVAALGPLLNEVYRRNGGDGQPFSAGASAADRAASTDAFAAGMYAVACLALLSGAIALLALRRGGRAAPESEPPAAQVV